MRNPRPFTVFQTIPGQIYPKHLFTIHAYSMEQARARRGQGQGETIVVAVTQDGAGR